MPFKSREQQAAVMALLTSLGIAAMMGAAGAIGSEAGSHIYNAAKTKASTGQARRQKYKRLQRIRAKTQATRTRSTSAGGRNEYARGPYPRGA